MSRAVYDLKDKLAIFFRNQRPQTTSRDITQQADPLHLTGSDLEGGWIYWLEACWYRIAGVQQFYVGGRPL